ncbi:DNA repair protein RecN [Reinekea marinisedimentorum]|uniref:DNA repair protein RecN n=1 Tax=Reinekea marinisedimentorum TaxID=230495 RepID=A0A4R3ICF3_9GAMM|nr:DNA repair protein RecN [Reinekea marinisedimentorum]TCS43246.1 DNA repair protein RecN (Recombination protein N) [Reinekea marinisedimentorum]
MLQNLTIRNIAIADNIEIDWQTGMTSISGETGAGKSILLNSLSLALGDRADSGIVRHGEKRAEVVASFNVERIPEAQQWLVERDLDEGHDCILRRTISAEGRSRGYINGQPVPLAELKTLGERLIDIHSQHAHQSLMRSSTHLTLLDDYGLLNSQKSKAKDAWLSWQGLERKYSQLKANVEENSAHRQLLQYQCEELNELDLTANEVEQLESDFQRMEQSHTLLEGAYSTISRIDNDADDGILAALKAASNALNRLPDNAAPLSSAKGLLDSAVIQVEECLHDLGDYIDSFDIDEEQKHNLESRLDSIHTLARKHQVHSNDLYAHHQQLLAELDATSANSDSLPELEAEVEKRKQTLLKITAQLTKQRKKAAKAFEAEIIDKLAQLAMPGARFEVKFKEQAALSHTGADQVEFYISLNPGQPLQPLAKVASGGELSRVSLAVQVVCAEHSTIPTLVFDEVDVGISGATAEIVGHMLRSVGSRGQVICVTHLPQVAAVGHNHCVVQKLHEKERTTTDIRHLNDGQRVDEIARMLGGIDITAQTRAHAEEMLARQQRQH